MSHKSNTLAPLAGKAWWALRTYRTPHEHPRKLARSGLFLPKTTTTSRPCQTLGEAHPNRVLATR